MENIFSKKQVNDMTKLKDKEQNEHGFIILSTRDFPMNLFLLSFCKIGQQQKASNGNKRA